MTAIVYFLVFGLVAYRAGRYIRSVLDTPKGAGTPDVRTPVGALVFCGIVVAMLMVSAVLMLVGYALMFWSVPT